MDNGQTVSTTVTDDVAAKFQSALTDGRNRSITIYGEVTVVVMAKKVCYLQVDDAEAVISRPDLAS